MGTLLVPASLCCALIAAAGACSSDVLPTKAASAGLFRGGSTPLSCETDADCDDGNPCTNDLCIDHVCVNQAIPNCVPCDEPTCPPLDLVFIMDTSGSMRDEAQALCDNIEGLVSDLAGLGIAVSAAVLGITETPGESFYCLEDDVVSLLGDTVPGDPGGCVFPGPWAYESWGPATAIVAARYPWTDGALRVVVPISDEGPCDGSFLEGCNDPGNDRESISNAIALALAYEVIASPITGTGSDDCVRRLAEDLAEGTGGVAFHSEDPAADLAGAIANLVLAACEWPSTCDDRDPCTIEDHCTDEGVCEGMDVETIPCSSDEDCFGWPCSMETGFCLCPDVPTLCLVASPGTFAEENCHAVGEEIIVNVELGFSAVVVHAGQFLIGYDPLLLDFVSIEPGSNVDPNSPFSLEIHRLVDEVAGRVFYAVAAPPEEPGTQGPAIMASLRFVTLTPCATDNLCLLDENPQNTRLTDANGASVPFVPCCSGELFIVDQPPTPNCPPSVEVNTDADGLTALVTWDGQERIKVASGDTVWVRRSDRRNRPIRTGLGLPFYKILREKLKWGFREPAERS